MKRYVRGVVAVLTLLAVAAAAPAAAAADEPRTQVDPWPNPAACATGEFTGHVGNPPGSPRLTLSLSGWAATCPDPKGGHPTGAAFGFAYFGWHDKVGATGRLFPERLRRYDNPNGATPFAGDYDFHSALEGSPDAMSICLMRDAQTRLACVAVSIISGTAGGSPTVTQVATDDPWVTGPVTVAAEPDGEGHPIDGGCGTCL